MCMPRLVSLLSESTQSCANWVTNSRNDRNLFIPLTERYLMLKVGFYEELNCLVDDKQLLPRGNLWDCTIKFRPWASTYAFEMDSELISTQNT